MQYATREQILAAIERAPEPTPEERAESRERARRLWDRMMAWLEAEERRWDRIIAAMEARARQPAESDLGWAVMALLDRGSGLYTGEARNTAARWIADALGGLPGDSHARAEVAHKLRVLGRREDRPRGDLRREIVLTAVPEATEQAGSLPVTRVRGNAPILLTTLADAMLLNVRRALREALGGEPVAEPHAIEALPALGAPAPILAEALALERRLTPGELAFAVALVCADGVIAEASRALGIAESTGRTYAQRIRQKIAAPA